MAGVVVLLVLLVGGLVLLLSVGFRCVGGDSGVAEPVGVAQQGEDPDRA